MSDHVDEGNRRDFLVLAGNAFAAVGAASLLWPFVQQMNPDASAKAMASTEFDLAPVKEGQAVTIMWRGKPIFIRNRTKEEIEEARKVDVATLPDEAAENAALPPSTPAADENRVKKGKENWLVLVGICTHLGCIPKGQSMGDVKGEFNGWFCPCHGSHYDTSGRIRKGRHPVISKCRRMNSFPIPRSRSLRSTIEMSGHASSYKPTTRWGKWWDERLPVMRMMHGQFVEFPTPRNLNYLWTFGGILFLCLASQIITGIILAMHYQALDTAAFNSIEHIRRDVNFGWLIRNMHAVGASMFFIAVYIHLFRGLYYGSYKAPREILWILGVIILLLMMATAFMGYVLPWGQMSFWGATVITNLFSAFDTVIPGLGTAIVEWLWGGYSVSGATLNRFFSLHYLLPFVLTGVVILHVWALHVSGQNNPTGLDIKQPSDAVSHAPLRDVQGRGRHVRLPHPVCVVRVLPARLPGPCGQL